MFQFQKPRPTPISDFSDGDGNALNASIFAMQDRETATRQRLDDAEAIRKLQAEVARLTTESAARLELMHDAYEYIDSLEQQLQDAQCAALSAQGGQP